MSEMIERVARAICAKMFENPKFYCGLDPIPIAVERGWRDFVGEARAAIEAMREPTKAMSARADAIESRGVDDEPINPDADHAYRAMVDEALR
jgi:hypothetical protein